LKIPRKVSTGPVSAEEKRVLREHFSMTLHFFRRERAWSSKDTAEARF